MNNSNFLFLMDIRNKPINFAPIRVAKTMTAISKQLFYEKITKDLACKHIHYWHSNCFLSTLHVIKEVTIGSAGFYVPIYLAQLALRYRRINKNYLKKLLLSYLRSVSYGSLFGTLFMSSFCVFASIFGRLNYYCMGFGPGVCSGCSIFIESSEMLVLNTLIFFTLVVETILRYLEIKGFWSRTVPQETLLFMSCSSMLMLLMSKRKLERFSHFWFYTPSEISTRDCKSCEMCTHTEESCSNYCLNGFSRYFLIGYAINLAKLLLGNFKRTSGVLRNLFDLLLKEDNFLFAAFFGAYVGIFRAISCALLKKQKRKRSWHMILAGFLSGLTYAIKPNLQMISIAITTILQNCVSEKTAEKFRLRELLFMLCTGVLTHTLLANNDICPKYYVNLHQRSNTKSLLQSIGYSYIEVILCNVFA